MKGWVLGSVLMVLVFWGGGGLGDSAEAYCPQTNVLAESLATTCWECLFPLSMFNVTMYSGDQDSHTAAAGPGFASYYPSALCGCICYGYACVPGIPLGIWEPQRIVEVVREPFCFPALGTSMGGGAVNFHGRGVASTQEYDDGGGHFVFYHAHHWSFPLWYLIGMALDQGCINPAGMYDDIDVLLMTEVLPTWDDDAASLMLFPESILFNNMIATAACAIDSLAAAVGFGLDPLFWCAGSWGHQYPTTGHVSGTHGGKLKGAALVMNRLIMRASRMGMEYWTSADTSLICTDYPTFLPVKSQFKFQMLYPIASTESPCCSPLGRTMLRWGLGKTVPVVGEDFVMLLWKLQKCCLL